MERTAFDDHLARLSRRERTAFVGALLTARGWDVEVDPPVVRATQGDRRRVVAVAREGFLRGYGLPRESVDAVVAVDADRTRRLATGREARAWDARTLYDMARYGLDAATTDRLFRKHLGEASESVGVPAGSGRGEPGAERDERPPAGTLRAHIATSRFGVAASDALTDRTGRTGTAVLVLLLVAVLVVGGSLAGPALTGAPSVDAAGDGSGTRDDVGVDGSDGGGDDDGDAASRPTVRTTTPTPRPRTIAPGLTAAGIADTAVLARSHAAVLENRSFTMLVTYTERVDGDNVGRARESVRVENGTVYRSRGTRSGNLTSDLIPVIVRDLYADGEGRYLRRGDGALRVGSVDDSGTGRFVERSRALVTWYLSGTDSSVLTRVSRSGVAYYRVAVEGTSDRRVDEYRVSALVSERGLVARLDAHYRLPGRDRVATLSLRHVNVGNTTVDRPGWMPPRPGSADRSVEPR